MEAMQQRIESIQATLDAAKRNAANLHQRLHKRPRRSPNITNRSRPLKPQHIVRYALPTKGMVRLLDLGPNSVTVQVMDVCMLFTQNGNSVMVTMDRCDAPPAKQLTLTREAVQQATAVIGQVLDTGFRQFLKSKLYAAVTIGASPRPSILGSDRLFTVDYTGSKLMVSSIPPTNVALGNYQGKEDVRQMYADIARAASMAGWFMVTLKHLIKTNSGVYRMPNRLAFPTHNTTWGSWHQVSPLKQGNKPVGRHKLFFLTTLPVRKSSQPNRPPPNIQPNATLGKGAYGTVVLSTVTNHLRFYLSALKHRLPRTPELPRDGTKVAVKVQHPQDNSRLQEAMQETTVHRRLLRTGAVPALYASGYDEQHNAYVTVMERIEGPTLASWLGKKRFLPQSMFDSIEKAVVEMWMAGIAHADLNPRNVIVTKDGPVIIDFGISIVLPHDYVPQSRNHARTEHYQDALLAYLVKTTKAQGFDRGSLDPHVLRWLHTFVA